MSGHTVQGWMFASRYGVPAASPASLVARRIAFGGQGSAQRPHRVQAARKPTSGSAPGGRWYRLTTTRSSARSMAFSTHCPKVDRNMARRSVGWYGIFISVKLPCCFETEEPAEAELVSARMLILSEVGTTGVHREVYPSDEAGLAQAMLGANARTGVGQEFDVATGDGIVFIGDAMASVAERGETHPLEQLLLAPV